MICESTVKKYCSEDISLIENYQEAINDTEMWDCHHRLEIQGELRFSTNKLKKLGYYWNRPACELVFLTRSEHLSIHHKGVGTNGGKVFSDEWRHNLSKSLKGDKHPMYGKHHSEETKKKISESNKGRKLSNETKKKISEGNKGKQWMKGENNPMFGNHSPHPKFKWLTPQGEIKIMAMNTAKQYHPDWVLLS